VKEGAQWSQPVQRKLPNFGELTGKNEFTLGPAVKVGDRPCREVRLKGTQSLATNLKWLGNVLTGTLKTDKLTGTYRFDAAGGKLAASEVQANLAGELRLGTDDKAPVFKLSFEHTLGAESRDQ
jgi:hypothetical protein